MALTDSFFTLAPLTFKSNVATELIMASGPLTITHTASYNTYIRIYLDIDTTDTVTYRLYVAAPGAAYGAPLKTFSTTGSQTNYITNQLMSTYSAGGYNFKLTTQSSTGLPVHVTSCLIQIYKT